VKNGKRSHLSALLLEENCSLVIRGDFVKTALAVLSFFLSLAAWMCAAASAQTTQPPIRVKCGGPAYTDSKGQHWSADYGFSGGLVSQTRGAVRGTSDPALFQTGRTAPDSGSYTYTFPVENGTYHVNMYFAELDTGDDYVGGRVFDVKMQNTLVWQNEDIFATVGAATAWIRTHEITVSNGAVQIEMQTVPGHDRAKVTAIEVTPVSPLYAPILLLNFVYPDGTPVAGAVNYTVATSALKLSGSNPLVNGQASCTVLASPEMMGLIGNVQLNLSLVDTSGHTLWQVGMTMDSTNVNLGGVQSSTLSVVVQKP
jgi:hypothetical protein